MVRIDTPATDPSGNAEPHRETASAKTSPGEPDNVFRAIVDSIPILAWTAHADGSVEFFNRQWLDYAGMTSEEALDWAWMAVFHPDDRDRVVDYWRTILTSGQPGEIEARMRRFDGMYRWFLIRCNAQRDEAGRVVRWYGTNTDIEDRHNAELAGRQRELSFRQIIDSIPGLVFTTTAAGETDFINRQLLEYFGRSLEELEGWMAEGTIHPEDLPRVAAHWPEAVQLGRPSEIELRLRRGDGAYRWFHYRATPLRDGQDRIVRWCVLATDIEDLKQAQEAMRSREDRLRLLVDSIPGLVYTRTAAGELEFVNRQLLEFFGMSVEELRPWQTNNTVHPDDLERTAQISRQGIESEQPTEAEIRLRRRDGVYRWCHFRHVPSRDIHGRLDRWYCLVSDIDDLKRAEEALRATQARLSRAMHVASLGELSASIAHEINQPLAAVVANGHASRRWLSSEPPNVERALITADRIIRDGNAAAEVVRRIRSLFNRVPPSKHVLNMNAVIEGVCELMADDLRTRGITLKTHLQADLPLAAVDPVQMQQVLANLIRNGCESMDSVADQSRVLSISSRSSEHEVVVEIGDCGIGIGDTQVIFESFYTTKTDGMGMGLSICRSIIEAHGGRLWVTDNVPRGSVFAFALRSAASEAEADASGPA